MALFLSVLLYDTDVHRYDHGRIGGGDLSNLGYTSLRCHNEGISSVFDGSFWSSEFDEFGFSLGHYDAGEGSNLLEDGFGDPVPTVDGDEAVAVGYEDDRDVQVDIVGRGHAPVHRYPHADRDFTLDRRLPDQVGHAGDVHRLDLTCSFGPNQFFGLSHVPLISHELEYLRGISPLN